MKCKWLQTCLCLLVVCILIFNIVTMPVQASALLQTLWIMGENAMMGIIRGLGIAGGNEANDLNTAAQEAWAAYKMTHDWPGKAEDKIQAYMGDPLGTGLKDSMYIVSSLVLWVRDWLFSSGLVQSGMVQDGMKYPDSFESKLQICLKYHDHVLAVHFTGGDWAIYHNQSTDFQFTVNGDQFHVSGKWGRYHSSASYANGTNTGWNRSQIVSYAYYKNGVSESVSMSTNRDLDISNLPSQYKSFSDAYEAWEATQQSIVDENGITQDCVALGLGETVEETASKTQAELWSGVATITQDTTQLGGTSWTKFKTWMQTLFAPVVSISTTVKGLLEWAVALPATLADVFANVLSVAFVPAEGYFDTKLEMLISRHAFANSVRDTVNSLNGFFQGMGSTPPIIWIDLGASRGELELGGRIKFVDLTWYAEYKPTVDVLISAFLYLWFVWRIAHSLPGILNGTSGMWGSGNVNFDLPLGRPFPYQEKLPPPGPQPMNASPDYRLGGHDK